MTEGNPSQPEFNLFNSEFSGKGTFQFCNRLGGTEGF